MEQEIKQVTEVALPYVNQLADKLLQYLQSGVALAQEQAPLFVNEILKWGIFENFVWGILCFIPILLYLYLLPKTYRKIKEIANDSDDIWGALVVGNFVGVVGSVIFTFSSISYLMTGFKAFLAPRLYLIEYLSNLVK